MRQMMPGGYKPTEIENQRDPCPVLEHRAHEEFVCACGVTRNWYSLIPVHEPAGEIAFDEKGYATVITGNPGFAAWALMRQGYVASVVTDFPELRSMQDESERETWSVMAIPEQPACWPKRGGMKQNLPPVLARTTKKLAAQGLDASTESIRDSFVLDEFTRHLWELADRFYSGEIEVVDEFLQLYCLDRHREGGPKIAPDALRIMRIVARDDLQFSEFCHTHGLDLKRTHWIRDLKDVITLANRTRLHWLPGGRVAGDCERVIAARRFEIIKVSERALLGMEAFEK